MLQSFHFIIINFTLLLLIFVQVFNDFSIFYYWTTYHSLHDNISELNTNKTKSLLI